MTGKNTKNPPKLVCKKKNPLPFSGSQESTSLIHTFFIFIESHFFVSLLWKLQTYSTENGVMNTQTSTD